MCFRHSIHDAVSDLLQYHVVGYCSVDFGVGNIQ